MDLCIPPELATIILDTHVGEPWIEAMYEFENKLDALKVRARVKAARDLSEVAEGLRIVVSFTRVAVIRVTDRALGSDQAPDVLSCLATAYPNKYDNQHASLADIDLPKV